MLAAIPTGTWIVLSVIARFTSPFCWVGPPAPPAGAVAVAVVVLEHVTGPCRSCEARTPTCSPQTFAATAMGTWTVLLTTATLTRPLCWVWADAGAAATPRARTEPATSAVSRAFRRRTSCMKLPSRRDVGGMAGVLGPVRAGACAPVRHMRCRTVDGRAMGERPARPVPGASTGALAAESRPLAFTGPWRYLRLPGAGGRQAPGE